jgi:hypothetical protein
MKPKVTLLLVIVFVCNFLSAYAAEEELKPGVVTGEIVGQQTQQPIAFASIALIQPETKEIVAGVISDNEGKFSLNQIPYGDYHLVVSFLGYKKKEVAVAIHKKANPFKVGTIVLEPHAEQLGEVTVEEERLKGKQEVDRTVYTINDKIQKMSTDGMDVLKYIPGVSVDFQDNVTLEGTGNILYRVNGITRDKDFVAQLHPADINKIEVVTNPGVEYDADVDAVINIVLKERTRGGRGSITAETPSPEGYVMNQRLSLEYGNDKFRVFLSNRTHLESFDATQITETRITDGTDQTSLFQKGSGNARWMNSSTNYGIDVFLNDNNTLNLYGSYYYHASKQLDYLQHGIQQLNGALTSEYNVDLNEESAGHGFYNSLFYKHDFAEKGQSYTCQFNYYNYSSGNKNDYRYAYSYLDGDLASPLIVSRFQEIDNSRNMLEWKNDYTQVFGKTKMKAGYWSYFQWYNNTFEADQNASDDFKFNEFRQEGYVSASGAFGKLSYSGGFRVAYSKSEIDSTATNEYLEWLPQLSLQYKLSKASSLKLSLRRRLSRPGMSQLNPFETMADSLTINRGNSNLNPQAINRAELQYGINIKSNYIAPKLYLDYSTNSIQQSSFINENGISIVAPDNVGERYEYGAALTAAIGPVRWLKIKMNTRLFNTKMKGPNNYSDEMMSWNINGTMIIAPWKDKEIGFMTQVQYQAPRLEYKQEITRDLLLVIGAEGQIYKGLKGSFFMIPTDGSFKYAGTERTDDNYYYKNTGEVNLGYFFAFSFTYTFDWGKQPKKLNRSTDFERDGGGGTL